MWYIHKMKYDSALKINEILMLAVIGMNLEDMMLNERSQIQKII